MCGAPQCRRVPVSARHNDRRSPQVVVEIIEEIIRNYDDEELIDGLIRLLSERGYSISVC